MCRPGWMTLMWNTPTTYPLGPTSLFPAPMPKAHLCRRTRTVPLKKTIGTMSPPNLQPIHLISVKAYSKLRFSRLMREKVRHVEPRKRNCTDLVRSSFNHIDSGIPVQQPGDTVHAVFGKQGRASHRRSCGLPPGAEASVP